MGCVSDYEEGVGRARGKPARIVGKYLRRFPEFVEFQNVRTEGKKPKPEAQLNGADEETPEDKRGRSHDKCAQITENDV